MDMPDSQWPALIAVNQNEVKLLKNTAAEMQELGTPY